jgi:hypothetical protein
MSYTHVLVSTLGKNESDPAVEWEYWVDGLAVAPQLASFALALRAKFPALKFHASEANGNCTATSVQMSTAFIQVYTDIDVYVNDCDYTLGVIGFGKNYGVSSSVDPQYFVESRKIVNNKYNTWRDQHNRLFCADEGKAIKNAITNLRPYSPKELVNAAATKYKNKIDGHIEKKRDEFHGVMSPLTYRDVLAAEIQNLVAKGVEFTTEPFIRAAAQAAKLLAERDVLMKKSYGSYFVNVRMMGSEQWVDIAEVATPRTTSYREPNKYTNDELQSMRIDDLPEDIKGKLAVIATCEVGHYVPEVGYRSSEKTFWVER